MKRVITAEFVMTEAAAGRRRIAASRETAIITPGAWSKARDLGVTFDDADEGVAPAIPRLTPAAAPPDDKGSAERVIDPSGLMVVRGRSVRLGAFTGAGPDRHIGLTDLVTGADGSPMTAGIMSWGREDSFPWSLDYDEIDLVLEGVLQISIDGRVLEGRAGDVFYIPKGSRIVFGTPNRTRVFYVTYPADWAAAANAPARPQK
jgi:ethanolamine utilization protein EutQ (cupin superfamily)